MTLEALQAAVADPATPAWLRRGLALWSRCGASVPLERCLRLPSSPRQFAIEQRNHWLRMAASHVESPQELAKVMASNIWRFEVWRQRGVPQSAGPLLVACFNAYESGVALPTSAKQLQRILSMSQPVLHKAHAASSGIYK